MSSLINMILIRIYVVIDYMSLIKIKSCAIVECLHFTLGVKRVSGFAVCLFILKNSHICCKLDISVNMAVEQG